MSDTPASLRRKISTAGDLQSVVRAMKALSASNVGQYEKSVRALDDYYRTVELGFGACLREDGPAATVAGRKKQADTGAIGVIVFGSDQGLVGRFNEAAADYALKALAAMSGKPHVWAVGERVHARLADAGVPLIGSFPVPSSVKAIVPLIGRILLDFEAQRGQSEIVELHLIYNRPTPGAAYATVSRRLLPLDEDWRRKLVGLPWPTKNHPQIMGGRTATLRGFIRAFLFVSLFRACAYSLASENESRLTAMQRAEKNIEDLLEDLNRKRHCVRQSGIDAELFDVVSGFEALGAGLALG